MKNRPPRKYALFFYVVVLAVCTISILIPKGPLEAGLWDSIGKQFLLSSLTGQGQYVGHQRNVDTKDPLFPVEVINDGFKMIRVYEDFPDYYTVEWTWRVLLKNKSSQAIEITFEYKLQDEDSLLVASSKECFRKISPGETTIIEKTDHLRYETAKRVMNSNWYIHLHN